MPLTPPTPNLSLITLLPATKHTNTQPMPDMSQMKQEMLWKSQQWLQSFLLFSRSSNLTLSAGREGKTIGPKAM